MSFMVKSGEFVFTVDKNEQVIDALHRQGLDLRVSCRNGVCGICEAKVVSGAMHDGMLNEKVLASDTVRLCRATVDANTVLETNTIKKQGELSVKEFACQVAAIDALSEDVYKVVLRLPAGMKAEFHPGQYLSINIPDADPAFFSIASIPGNRDIVLHVQASEARESAMQVLNHLKNTVTVKISLPYGKACLSQLSTGPIALIGAGTGYAQLMSIMDGLIDASFKESIYLFWGGRTKKELYLLEEAVSAGVKHENISVFPVYGDVEDNEWSGHHDQLVDAVLANCQNVSSLTCFVSGSPGLVYTAMDALVERGLGKENFYSDVLEYAPRD